MLGVALLLNAGLIALIDETCFCRDSEHLIVGRMVYDDAVQLSGNEMSYRVKKLLVALVLVTAMMSALLQRFAPVKETRPALSPTEPAQQDEQLIAVISAAVHKYRSRHKP